MRVRSHRALRHRPVNGTMTIRSRARRSVAHMRWIGVAAVAVFLGIVGIWLVTGDDELAWD